MYLLLRHRQCYSEISEPIAVFQTFKEALNLLKLYHINFSSHQPHNIYVVQLDQNNVTNRHRTLNHFGFMRRFSWESPYEYLASFIWQLNQNTKIMEKSIQKWYDSEIIMRYYPLDKNPHYNIFPIYEIFPVFNLPFVVDIQKIICSYCELN